MSGKSEVSKETIKKLLTLKNLGRLGIGIGGIGTAYGGYKVGKYVGKNKAYRQLAESLNQYQPNNPNTLQEGQVEKTAQTIAQELLEQINENGIVKTADSESDESRIAAELLEKIAGKGDITKNMLKALGAIKGGAKGLYEGAKSNAGSLKEGVKGSAQNWAYNAGQMAENIGKRFNPKAISNYGGGGDAEIKKSLNDLILAHAGKLAVNPLTIAGAGALGAGAAGLAVGHAMKKQSSVFLEDVAYNACYDELEKISGLKNVSKAAIEKARQIINATKSQTGKGYHAAKSGIQKGYHTATEGVGKGYHAAKEGIGKGVHTTGEFVKKHKEGLMAGGAGAAAGVGGTALAMHKKEK